MKKTMVIIPVLLILAALFYMHVEPVRMEQSFTEIVSPGFYGPAEGRETITGDVIISVSGVQLQNIDISGNLYYTVPKDTGIAFIKLHNVTVDKAMIAHSNCENHITLNNSTITELNINEGRGIVRVTATGKSKIPTAQIFSAAQIQENQSLASPGFAAVTVNTPAPVAVGAALDNLSILSQAADVTITGGIITLLFVAEEAANTKLHLALPALVSRLELHSAAAVSGQGTVEDAWLLTGEAVFETTPVKLSFATAAAENRFYLQEPPAPQDPAHTGATPTQPVILYAMNPFTLAIGGSASATVGASPAEGVTFTAASANPAVATVSMEANTIHVRAISPGTTQITIRATHPDFLSGSAAYPVTVFAPRAASPVAEFTPNPTLGGIVFTLFAPDEGALIYYTTDNSTPTVNSLLYPSGAVHLVPPGEVILKAIAVKAGMINSEVAVFTYSSQIPPEQDPPGTDPAEEPNNNTQEMQN